MPRPLPRYPHDGPIEVLDLQPGRGDHADGGRELWTPLLNAASLEAPNYESLLPPTLDRTQLAADEAKLFRWSAERATHGSSHVTLGEIRHLHALRGLYGITDETCFLAVHPAPEARPYDPDESVVAVRLQDLPESGLLTDFGSVMTHLWEKKDRAGAASLASFAAALGNAHYGVPQIGREPPYVGLFRLPGDEAERLTREVSEGWPQFGVSAVPGGDGTVSALPYLHLRLHLLPERHEMHNPLALERGLASFGGVATKMGERSREASREYSWRVPGSPGQPRPSA